MTNIRFVSLPEAAERSGLNRSTLAALAATHPHAAILNDPPPLASVTRCGELFVDLDDAMLFGSVYSEPQDIESAVPF